MFTRTLKFLLLACATIAAPLESRENSLIKRACPSIAGDAPYSFDCGAYTSTVTCPTGITGRDIVFLVHGTTSTGEETWQTGPYVQLLPSYGDGYDVCYVTIPGRSLDDAQVNAEYVAYNIQDLAGKSANGKVYVIGHSQGNLNIQWALAFWPSLRPLVSGFGSIAGDFFGTAEGPLVCLPQMLLQGGCGPSVIQQTIGSNYLAAHNRRGGSALVPTLSVYTITDDIIQPEIINPTSALPGATVASVQELCSLLRIEDHFTITVSPVAFHFIADTIQHGGVPDRSRFEPRWCSYLTDGIDNPDLFRQTSGLLRQAFLDGITLLSNVPRTHSEPAIKAYAA